MKYWILAGIIVLGLAGCADTGGGGSSDGASEAQNTNDFTWDGTINEDSRGTGTLSADVTYNGFTYIGSWAATFSSEAVDGTLIGKENSTQIWGDFRFTQDPGCSGSSYSGQWAGNRALVDFATYFCDITFRGTMDFVVAPR